MADPREYLLDRRTLLTELGRGVIGVAVFGAVWWAEPPAGAAAATPSVRYARANLGFVNAYVLARGREAVVIDTGVAGSEAGIEKAVRSLGLRWDAVRHVVVTHAHPDHAGSLPAVLAKAAKARTYAGADDVAHITSPRAITAVKDGDSVFGLEIVATPGHTPGHVCVLEPKTGILVAGDALGTSGGVPIGPNPQFTADMAEARRSVAKLAKESFETLLVGHGDPITKGAARAVAALAG